MKLGTVIGRVTLSKTVKALEGGRYLVVSPFSRERFAAGLDAHRGRGTDPSLVVYDAIGGGVGDVIGYEEGREAAQPFEVGRRSSPLVASHCCKLHPIALVFESTSRQRGVWTF